MSAVSKASRRRSETSPRLPIGVAQTSRRPPSTTGDLDQVARFRDRSPRRQLYDETGRGEHDDPVGAQGGGGDDPHPGVESHHLERLTQTETVHTATRDHDAPT